MTERILITGASGFIGKALVTALSKQGYVVRAAARDPAGIIAASDVERVAIPDLVGSLDWSPLLAGVTHVVHLAGIAHAPGTLPDDVYMQINAEAVGTLAQQAKGKVARVVLKDVLAVLLAGLGGGILLSLAMRHVMGMYISGVPAFDAPTLTSAPALLTGIVALAAVLPLRRALRVSASIALRAE